MEKQEVKSKWDELARQVGAEISPEIEQVVDAPTRAAAQTETPESYLSETSVSVAPPKRPAAGWDSLASDFGLPIPEPPVEATVDRPAPPVPRVEESRAHTDEAERPGRERSRPARRERSDSRRESRGPGREEGRRRGEERSHEREGRSQRRERHPRRERPERAPRSEDLEEVEQHESADRVEPAVAETASPPVAPPQVPEPPKPAAISLWHKIFGLPTEQSAKQAEPEPATERPVADFRVDEPRSLREDHFELAAPASDKLDSEVTDDTELDEEAVAPSDAGATPADQRRPRRRRRGRGGRGRRGDGDRDEGRSIDRRHRKPDRADIPNDMDRDDELLDVIGDALDEDALEPSTREAELEGDGAGLDDSDEEPAARGKSALQRSIPSWDEAIGYIIDVNMQGRSQRRQSSHSGARSNGPRGRTRGRRRRS
jgi:hypothetical protein